jgi:BirA family biotin operon repressor/biotin-[acetyl-CoA-carboxylase] ligase
MSESDEPLDPARITEQLGDVRARFRVLVRDRCGSTNTELAELARAGAAAGTVLACEQQLAGRGRRGRQWSSPGSGGLTFSVLWRFPPGSAAPSGLSLAAGVAVAEALSDLGVSGIALKWPNDILRDTRKAGGILIEALPAANGAIAAVIGIGLNVKLPAGFAVDSELGAADLSGGSLGPLSRGALLARVLVRLAGVMDEFTAGGFAALRARWFSRAAYLGEPVRLLGDAHPIEGVFAGADHDGAALLETDGATLRVLSGDLSLRKRT